MTSVVVTPVRRKRRERTTSIYDRDGAFTRITFRRHSVPLERPDVSAKLSFASARRQHHDPR